MAKRGYKLQEFVAHSSNVNCLSIGKKACRLLLTGGDDHKVNLWAIGKPVSLMSLCGHTSPIESVAFDAAEILVVAGAYSGMIKLWDLEEAKMVRSLNGHNLNCNAVAFHPFGEFFASGSMDSNLRIWDIKKKECIHTYKGHTGGISTIRFSPDGRWVVSGGDDNAVKIWDLTAGKLLHDFKFHEGPIRSIDFHPLEFLLATGSADKTVKFWDLETFELIGSARPEATGVRSITFHPDGRTLFCGLEDSLKVYSWEPLIRHDAVDMGWSTLGDLCIHDGKALGCSYYQNSVGVWVADISIIEPYGAGFVSKQNNEMELKCNMQRSYSAEKITSTMMSSRSMSSDYENKEIKNIYVDSTGGKPITSQTVQSMSSPVKTALSQTIQSLSPPGKPVISQTVESLSCPVKPVVSQTVQSLSSSGKLVVSEIVQSLSSPGQPVVSQTVLSLSSPKVVVPSNSKETSDLSSQKKNPAPGAPRKRNGNTFKKSFVAPSIVPRDSPPGKGTSNLRRESITGTKDIPDSLIKPAHIQRTSYRNRVDVSRLSGIDEGGSLRKSDVDSSVNPNFKSRLILQRDAKECSEQNHQNAENIEKIILPQTPSTQENSSGDAPLGCSKEMVPVRVVNGVVVVRGRTRSLVERFERREGIEGNDDDHMTMVPSQVLPLANKTDDHKTMVPSQVIPVANKTDDDHKTTVPSKVITVPNETDDDHKTMVHPQLIPVTDKPIITLNAEPQLFIPESASANHEKFAEDLLQNHDVFLNTIRSRLTKLQVIRHFWERNDTKGAINALRKLPDQSVHADVVSVLNEKTEILNLDLFSCLLPVLVGLLGSTMERHTIVSLEMLIKLGGVFGSVIRLTVSARPAVGVNLQAEQRLECCKGCFIHFQKILKILPVLIRRGGVMAKCAMELNLVLQER